jgi:hypothetical protein
VNSEWERRFLFSVWDAGSGTKVTIVDAHQHSIVRPFGGEGEGLQAILYYKWKTDEAYSFRVTAEPNAENMTTVG